MLVADPAVRGFELVLLSISLSRHFAARGFPIQLGAGAIVERSVKVNPDLRIGIA
jgi:hypothetical protein